MSDVLGRLLPAIRDVRTPLALGYALFALAWAAVTLISDSDPADDPVGSLYLQMTDDLPALVEFGAVTFVATLVGSGLVRLVDRFMRMTPRRRRGRYNPFDANTPLARAGEAGQDVWLQQLFRWVHRKLDPDRDEATDHDPIRTFATEHQLRWALEPATYERERQQFLFHLARDQEFDAHASEQLMRAVMFLPSLLGLAGSVIWFLTDREPSIAAVGIAFLLLTLVLWADYGRIGTLMNLRWTALAREYPSWLPLDYQTHRQRETELVEQTMRTALDAVTEGWARVVAADAARRTVEASTGQRDESQLVPALTDLGARLTRLATVPGAGPLVDDVDQVDRKIAEFRELVRVDDGESAAARDRAGEQVGHLSKAVRVRIDHLAGRPSSTAN